MPNNFHEILKQKWGFNHFRPLQLQAIEAISQGKDTLVLMPTGGGKSLIYQIPALCAEGVCIVITPLISLMKDQVDRLRSKRILAEAIHSGVSAAHIDRILDNCIYGDVKFLYISPERIDSELFRMRLLKMKISLVAVDEAHCIAQWGHDFRPAYLQIARLREWQPNVPILALSASATPEVAQEIMHQLKFKVPHLLSMSFARPKLSYLVRQSEDKLGHLLRITNNVEGSGIIYVRTRERSENIAQWLQQQGISAESYNGGMGYHARTRKQEAWSKGQTRVMVATNAFGMGIDKADVRFVVHYDLCDSLESYYQEAGRAGRDGAMAYAVILLSAEDQPKANKRLSLEFPPLETIKALYEGLFNDLQIAIGEGKSKAININLFELAHRLKVFTPTLINAFKILQQNGYLILTEEVDHPPRVQFIVQRDELYRMRVERRELDYLITLLLRQYTGLFSSLQPIDEDELAHLSGYTSEHIGELLKKLRQLHLIRYVPGSTSPLLILTEERLPTSDLHISVESYQRRKEMAQKRLEGMVNYIENTAQCRSEMIQHYFGEQATAPCGVCDRCREQKKSTPHPDAQQKPHPIDLMILEVLSKQEVEIKSLTLQIPGAVGEVLARITQLLEEGKIAEHKGGKLQIIP